MNRHAPQSTRPSGRTPAQSLKPHILQAFALHFVSRPDSTSSNILVFNDMHLFNWVSGETGPVKTTDGFADGKLVNVGKLLVSKRLRASPRCVTDTDRNM